MTTTDSDREMTTVLELVPSALREEIVLAAAERNPRFAVWLADEARGGESAAERTETTAITGELARRVRARKSAAALARKMPYRRARVRAAEISGTVLQVREIAAQQSCAPLMDLAIAAGAGVALWDASCESWLELPGDLAHGECFASPVTGDSMAPFLEAGDRILIRIGTTVSPGDVVVARTDDDGYVVKHAVSADGGGVRLCSVNPEHPDLELPREPSAIVGTVVARFRRE